MGMKYEPIKDFLNKVFRKPFLRKIFYKLIDILLLRTWYIHRFLRKWLAQNQNRELSILDAGSGLGQHSYYIAKKCKKCKILGVDINSEQVSYANEFFRKIGMADRVEFIVGDLQKFIMPESFDLILNVEVIEHIEDDQQVLNNFYKSLKPGGILLLTTPSLFSEHHHDDDEKGSFVDEHVRDGYSPEDLKAKLEKAGFRDVEIRYMYGKYGGFAWKLAMKYPIILLNKSFLFFLILPFYYLFTMPIVLLFDYLDLKAKNKKGGALFVVAKKLQ